MRELAEMADILTPNLTEACILTERPFGFRYFPYKNPIPQPTAARSKNPAIIAGPQPLFLFLVRFLLRPVDLFSIWMPSCVLCIFCLYFINCCICLSVSHPNCTDYVGCGFECTSLVPFYIIPSYSTSVFTGTVTYNPPLHIFWSFAHTKHANTP